MGARDLPSNARISLERASVLLLEASDPGIEILLQILSGFGVKGFHPCTTVAAARNVVERTKLDLIIAEVELGDPEVDGLDYVHWLRRSGLDQNSMCPVILISGHTTMGRVQRARDCGADFIVAKPLVPQVLLQRVIWAARDTRQVVETADYVGPDRRHRNLGPPLGMEGRRSTDLGADIGEALEENMSQDEIDNFMTPTRAVR